MSDITKAKRRYKSYRRVVKKQYDHVMAAVSEVYDIDALFELSAAFKVIANNAIARFEKSNTESKTV
jgi:hypothetical protein